MLTAMRLGPVRDLRKIRRDLSRAMPRSDAVELLDIANRQDFGGAERCQLGAPAA